MKYLVILILTVNFYSFSQNEILKDSIIHLEEIILYENNKNCTKIKTEGKKNSTFSVSNKSEIVTLISNIPTGRLNSIKLFFNKRNNMTYEKNHFRLKIYDIKHNLPHKEIISKELRFTVSKKKEYITLDLSPLELKNRSDIFIGVELLNQNENLSFSIDCNTNSEYSNTFYKHANSDNWLKIPNIDLRMELDVSCN